MSRFVRRRWGWYLTLVDRKHFKVKLLKFNKSGSCSNQLHNFRNELWLFLAGNGYLNCHPIKAGEWAQIHVHHAHMYSATTKTYVLEVQYGDKCEETDIVRI